MSRVFGLGIVVLVLIAMTALDASAYVGPGAGLTAIGAALAFVGGIILAIFGFLWYPIKRLLRGRGKRRRELDVRDQAS